MKTLLLTLCLLLLAGSTLAADQPGVLQINPPKKERVESDIGMTQIHTRAADIRIAWLPLLAPLPYSYPRTTQEIPNALVLTGTQIPQRARTVTR